MCVTKFTKGNLALIRKWNHDYHLQKGLCTLPLVHDGVANYYYDCLKCILIFQHIIIATNQTEPIDTTTRIQSPRERLSIIIHA